MKTPLTFTTPAAAGNVLRSGDVAPPGSRAAGGCPRWMRLWRRAVGTLVALSMVTLCVHAAKAQTALINGGNQAGTILANATNSYTFSATNGDSVVVRVGQLTSAGYFNPWLRIYGPDGALVGSGAIAGDMAEEVVLTATNSGTFTVLVSDGNYAGYAGTGTYQLDYFKVPGDYVVPTGDEGGSLTNGTLNFGTITVGDLDAWGFTATNGDSVVVRVGQLTSSAYFSPWLRIYGPDGALVGSGAIAGDVAEEVVLAVTNSGRFTVLVSDGNYSGYYGTGTYQLNYLKLPSGYAVSPGDEGGPLANGTLNAGTISVGDLDAWSFTATSGDSVVVRVGQLTSTAYFNPWLRIYGPDGTLVGSGAIAGDVAEEVVLTATNSGTYTVLVSDGNYSGYYGTGTYQLNYLKLPGGYAVSPGDDGGPLTNGTLNVGTISVGDLDAWSFTATNGDSVVVRVGQLTSSAYFSPWLRIYGPDGALVGSGAIAGDVAEEVALTATNGGTYTVLVSDGNYAGYYGTGTYELNYLKVPGEYVVSPGEDGGTLTNGTLNVGTISTGDLDVWSFSATNGDSLVVRVGQLTTADYFSPWLRIYGPDGALIGSSPIAGAIDQEVELTATNSGTFTVLVSDGNYSGYYGTGNYALSLAQAPGAVFASPGDEGGMMTNGVTYTGTNSLGDLDVWSFYGTVGDSNLFRIATTNFTPWLRLYAPSGALVAQAFTANSGNRTNFLSYIVTNSGSYTLVSSAYYLGQSGTYALKQSRVPPDLNVPATQVLNEGETLNVTISAQDPDVPFQPLSFTPISLPPGANLSQTGPTNASITWPTTEASGPSTNVLIASVTDVVNGKAFTRTNSFIVIVNELNEPPVLTLPAQQVIDELTPLNVSASATDPDIPANPLTFRLVSPPTGMTIDSITGAIAWMPTETQGPSTNTITVVVTDTNPPAVNTTSISVTNSFLVIVHEVNLPPQLTVPGNQTITELTPLNVSASATDPDIPANPLTFSLVSPPTGMTIDPNTGAIAWIPSEAQGPGVYTIAVAVTDFNPTAANAQHLSVTNSFTVTVNESNSPPRFTAVPGAQIITELTPLSVAVTAADDDLPANPLTYALVSPPSGMNINPATGDITWTPSEAQGSNSYTITVTVTDTNAAAINQKQFTITTNFTVTVNESNSPPVLTVPGAQTLDELTPLAVSASATDSDIPANPLTFALISPPSGMSINPASGAITWTPTEAQGPGVYTITVSVTDTNRDAINQRQFTVTNSFVVTVNESNSPPVLQTIANQSLHYGVALSIQAAATDSDIPTNTLTFSLDSSPSNMTINATSGLISWTPALAQLGTNTITVRVTDNGVPPKFDTTTFKVVVTGNAPVLSIGSLPGNLKQVIITGDVGSSYDLLSSSNLLNWDLLLNFNLTTSPKAYIGPDSATIPRRFYQLRLAP
jgi:hypothetical protein